MALGSTQPLTEMSTRRNLSGDKWWPPREADNLTAICLENVGASTVCYKEALFFTFFSRRRIRSRQQLERNTNWFKYIKKLRQASKESNFLNQQTAEI
jgi:hypothetical protein